MEYAWDEGKRHANLAKHGVDFADAKDFEWDTAMEALDDRFSYGEERWVALGYIRGGVHVLVYTRRNDAIRVISLRKAIRNERLFYEKKT